MHSLIGKTWATGDASTSVLSDFKKLIVALDELSYGNLLSSWNILHTIMLVLQCHAVDAWSLTALKNAVTGFVSQPVFKKS